ncbi:hypothetical protein [Mycolicibacterium sp. J2]|uniref:hypothetical protein n=1 Tax=Mycolicibacterium sp. J2 TaxID=2993511 RepID=UPI00224AE731|nr:hypothetical protein [Mycolicibacterium sp. J2]MCX2712060.1 hypothetical protein [Mycolicibacterium sp. J2]
MYLSAERVAMVNHTIKETFEQTCVAWQAIPHWDTGDPGQTAVVNDDATNPVVTVNHAAEPVNLTVGELISPTPDAVLAKVTPAVVALAAKVDGFAIPLLCNAAPHTVRIVDPADDPPKMVGGVIDARVLLESAGFRAPSAAFADAASMKALYQLVNGYAPVKDSILDAGNINAPYRVGTFTSPDISTPPTTAIPAGDTLRAVVLGRRQRIAPGYAADASPGEEPVDLAVSITPSFEIVGETAPNNVLINVRISYAVRPKAVNGLVLITSGP